VGVGGLTVSGVSRNRGGFVKCVAIQKRLGIRALATESHWKISEQVPGQSVRKICAGEAEKNTPLTLDTRFTDQI
jgi:hypothetical protein